MGRGARGAIGFLAWFNQESEALSNLAGHEFHDITVKSGGEKYGIDINQGYVALQYGITEKWAADLNVGATTLGWRLSSPTVSPCYDRADGSFLGRALSVFNETNADLPWLPTLTFRAGAVLPGSYSQQSLSRPGSRSAGIEPELILRRHFGWPGREAMRMVVSLESHYRQ